MKCAIAFILALAALSCIGHESAPDSTNGSAAQALSGTSYPPAVMIGGVAASMPTGNTLLVDQDARVTGRLAVGNAPSNAFQSVWIDSANQATTTQVFVDETDTLHTAYEAINYVGFQQATFDTSAAPANAVSGDFEVTSTRAAGSAQLTNIAVLASATGGDVNYSFYSVHGTFRNDGPATLGDLDVTNTFTDNGTFTISNANNRVTLGQNVDGFKITDGGAIGALLGIGTINQGTQFAIKNTDTKPAGVTIHADTSLSATESGYIGMFRGSGNGAEMGGIALIGNSGSYCAGSTTNDLCLYSYDPASAGRSLEFATGSGPTVRVKITGAGDLELEGSSKIRLGGTSGATISSGAGAPSFSAAKGSIYTCTNCGAGSTLYVNETGTATWAAK